MSRQTIDRALADLEAELLYWPGFLIEEMGRGVSTAFSAGTTTESINPNWWYVLAKEQEGPKGRGHYQGNGHTLREAIVGLTTELVSRRTEPHRWHISDWMQEGRFVVGCPGCEKEAAELFAGQVDWEPA